LLIKGQRQKGKHNKRIPNSIDNKKHLLHVVEEVLMDIVMAMWT